jgi:hypothetical protein
VHGVAEEVRHPRRADLAPNGRIMSHPNFLQKAYVPPQITKEGP